MFKYNKYKLLTFCLFSIISFISFSQEAISERRKVRYLKKIERKNDRYVKQQEKKTHKLLANLSAKEEALYKTLDSTKVDSALVKNSFSKIEERFAKEDITPEAALAKLSQPVSIDKSISINNIPENLNGDIKDYLKQQITTSAFLADTNCTTCKKLKEQTAKAKQNIEKTSEKLDRLKSVQDDIKKHQETLKSYGVTTPELAGKLKDIDKSCYYYTQGVNGFKDMYTNPAKGIESSMLKNLSFNKDFKIFQTQFTALPFSTSGLTGNAMPDMTGYQTKAQVQAMLPQNAQGISADAKAQLINNMQSGLMKFTELRDEKPDLSMLKDKPKFKMNPFKGIPLRKRLVPGFTFQPQVKKLNEPFVIDLGATLGFKLTERLTPMVGVTTKTGFGKDIHQLAFSYEGIVAKAGLDTKLCYGFSFQAWYEATWRPYSAYIAEGHLGNYPQPSLIAGICNTYKISKKVNGTFMIGYDFFYTKHTPYTSPWVIRLGWQ
jgi:DNA-binding protein H-NS